jgi:heptosyltransferase-2
VNSHPPSSTIDPRSILVRGVNWLGDAVMTTPALLRLRERFPKAHITMLCPEKLVDLWRGHPAIDGVISLASDEGAFLVGSRLRKEPWLRFIAHTSEQREAVRAAYQETAAAGGTLAQAIGNIILRVSEETTKEAQEARKLAFDLALVLPNSPRSALEMFFARIPQRIGYARPWRNFFLTQAVPSRAGAVKMHKRSVAEIKQLVAVDVSPRQDSVSRVLTNAATSAHQTHEYLHLVAALGANPEPLAPLLFVTLEEIEAAKKKFGLEEISGPVFGLNPGAEYGPAKRWPVERFITAAQEIQKRINCTWLLFGGKSDTAITSQIAAALHASRITHHDLSGKTTLRELMALLKVCNVLLTNDTGPMHVAAALGTPVVVPFGSTSPELTGPGLPGDTRHQLLKSNVPCAPCFLRECPIDFRCMNGIRAERVAEAVIETVKREA